MNRIKPSLYRASSLVGLVLTMPIGRALAEDIEPTVITDSYPATSSAATTGILASFWIIILVIFAVSLAFFVWWILMLVDAFKRTNWTDDSQKTTWLAILIVGFIIGFGWLATLLYYFMIRKPLGKAGGAVAPVATASQQPSTNASSAPAQSPPASDNNPTTTKK